LVFAVAKLHNFCIDDTADNNNTEVIEEEERAELQEDPLQRFENWGGTFQGYIALPDSDEHDNARNLPRGLLDLCNHFSDLPREIRRESSVVGSVLLPREFLHDKVVDSHMVRPATRRRRSI
jgi:hypothetical protein